MSGNNKKYTITHEPFFREKNQLIDNETGLLIMEGSLIVQESAKIVARENLIIYQSGEIFFEKKSDIFIS